MPKIKLPSGVFEYDPRKPLGKRGGFGQVFLGKAASGKVVAIKKLHVSAADAAHRELRIADELKGRSFEHVIPFIDSGEDPDTGEYFLVMPRAGRSLQDAVQQDGKLRIEKAADVLLQIVKGLNEVKELVHRDLKPDNVLWHDGRWKVADFGIARFVEEATASNTLKDCLSPHYAAPEQWRFEHATHATDIYAMGCIGFFLLTGKPPFVTQPEEQHQKEPLPKFDCGDGRLRALIHNMARKLPETRPASARVEDMLGAIVEKPQGERPETLAGLAAAGARIAEREQQIQAKLVEEQSAKQARKSLAASAFEILMDNMERLWGKISAEAPNAHRHAGERGMGLECVLGDATLTVTLNALDYLQRGTFQHSEWDVVASAVIALVQTRPQYVWSASLWYAKLRGATEFRWHEVSYFRWSGGLAPFAASTQEADYAASNITYPVNVAFGPVPIDDEREDEFHDRWIFLFTRAACGQLRQPSSLPIHGWPPQF
jgi:serine/threonine protein kinase